MAQRNVCGSTGSRWPVNPSKDTLLFETGLLKQNMWIWSSHLVMFHFLSSGTKNKVSTIIELPNETGLGKERDLNSKKIDDFLLQPNPVTKN